MCLAKNIQGKLILRNFCSQDQQLSILQGNLITYRTNDIKIKESVINFSFLSGFIIGSRGIW